MKTYCKLVFFLLIRRFLTFLCALLERRAKETTRCYSSNDRFVWIKCFLKERNEVASSWIKVGLLKTWRGCRPRLGWHTKRAGVSPKPNIQVNLVHTSYVIEKYVTCIFRLHFNLSNSEISSGINNNKLKRSFEYCGQTAKAWCKGLKTF